MLGFSFPRSCCSKPQPHPTEGNLGDNAALPCHLYLQAGEGFLPRTLALAEARADGICRHWLLGAGARVMLIPSSHLCPSTGPRWACGASAGLLLPTAETLCSPDWEREHSPSHPLGTATSPQMMHYCLQHQALGH